MLFVLSPAKTLDVSPPSRPDLDITQPAFQTDTAALVRVARKLRPADLTRLMGVSASLAELNVARFKAMDLETQDGALPAAFAFAGDVYQGLRARELDGGDLRWAQGRLRILSGLYGLLRPLDAIQPYRLEMGVALPTRRGATLYEFWGDRLAKALGTEAQDHADPTVVNLASREYFRAVDRPALKAPVLSISFKEDKDGKARVLAFFAKRARGAMARFAIEARAERAEELQGFEGMGYRFRPDLSQTGEWVFSRPQP